MSLFLDKRRNQVTTDDILQFNCVMTVATLFARSALAVLRDQGNKEAGVNPALFPQL